MARMAIKANKAKTKSRPKEKSYILKNTTKARVKIGVQGSRAQLAYKELAKAAAAGENTKIQRGIRQMHSGAETDGAALKEGMLAMLDRVGASTEEFNAIASMDEELLAQMYNTNDITFEVFFNYEGINKVNGSYLVSDEKRQDVKWFIEQYNKVAAGMRKQKMDYLDSFANDVI